MVTKGNSESSGQGQKQRSQPAVTGTGGQFKHGSVGGDGLDGKASSKQIPRSIDNPRAPYSDPTGSSSLLLLESKVRRATPQVSEGGEESSKRPVALQRWLSQNQDFPEYWHSHGGAEDDGDVRRRVEDREKEDEESQKRHKELGEYPQGADD